METTHTETPAPPSPIESAESILVVPQRVNVALTLLLESFDYAQDLEEDCWAFAVELAGLRKLGLTNSDLRWLVGKQFLEHAREVTTPSDLQRSFRRAPTLRLTKSTCFVLTHTGVGEARKIRSRLSALPPWDASLVRPPFAEHSPVRPSLIETPLAPIWDRNRQELRVEKLIVKQFKVPAANQETVLAAFQEENWPTRIDDPLSPGRDHDPKRRLHDTICSLNRNQKRPLIRFSGDGSGQGVRWEFTDELQHMI